MTLKVNSKENTEIKQIGCATLERGETLHLKSEFGFVHNNGLKFVGRYMILISAANVDNTVRFGVICGKRYSKRAVKRNRARRLIKESFRLLKAGVKSSHNIFIVRQRMKHAKLQEIQKEMIYLLKKADLMLE
jgi:ribonuclease P protein component